MKRTNKAFTIVEVIIVIAVIGILAAILILALPKAIEEAHEKSALSDAKNTLTETAIETDPADKLNKNYIIIVEKYEKEYVFACEDGGEITPYELNPFGQCNRAELANALCDMGLVQAPLGLNEITLDEQFDNISLFTGGKLQSPQRIDVEVNCEADLPNSGILNVTWKTENTSIASIQDGKIHGKAVGKTTLTAMCDDIRIAYSLYVGKRANVSNFDELKAVIEDESESVFIYNTELSPFWIANRDDIPVTIPQNKYVRFCCEEHPYTDTDENGEEHEYIGNFYIYIVYFYDIDHAPSALFVNDGGYLVLDAATIEMQSSQDEGLGLAKEPMPPTGSAIINRNGGYVEFKNCSACSTSYSPSYVDYVLGLPANPTHYEQSFLDTAIYMENNRSDIDFLNEDGELLIDSSDIGHVKNCENGVLNIKNTIGEANPQYKWTCGIHYLENEGTVYSIDRMRAGMGGYKYEFVGIRNTGIIYEIKNSTLIATRGGTAIESSGTILSIENTSFEPSLAATRTEKQLMDGFHITREQAKEYLSKPIVALRIKGGRIGEIRDCDFSFEEIVFDGTQPYAFITSGKFAYEPDGRMICGSSECIYDEESGTYVVQVRAQ